MAILIPFQLLCLAHGACFPANGRAPGASSRSASLAERVPRPALKAARQNPIEALRYE